MGNAAAFVNSAAEADVEECQQVLAADIIFSLLDYTQKFPIGIELNGRLFNQSGTSDEEELYFPAFD